MKGGRRVGEGDKRRDEGSDGEGDDREVTAGQPSCSGCASLSAAASVPPWGRIVWSVRIYAPLPHSNAIPFKGFVNLVFREWGRLQFVERVTRCVTWSRAVRCVALVS